MVDARVATQLGEHGAQRVAAVEVVRAVARDDEQMVGAQPREEEAQDVARGRVGPVQVLDDQDERGAGAPGAVRAAVMLSKSWSRPAWSSPLPSRDEGPASRRRPSAGRASMVLSTTSWLDRSSDSASVNGR